MTAYDYVTQNKAYVETIYQTITVTATTTVPEPAAGRRMIKRTSSAEDARPNTPYTARRTSNRQPTGEAPPIPTATVLTSPNHDRLELRLLRMGLLVKRVATFTYTVT